MRELRRALARRVAAPRSLDTAALRAGRAAICPGLGPTLLGDVERLSARTWALGVPRNLTKIVGTMYEDARNVGLVGSNPFSNLRLPVSEKTEEVYAPSMDDYRACSMPARCLAATALSSGR